MAKETATTLAVVALLVGAAVGAGLTLAVVSPSAPAADGTPTDDTPDQSAPSVNLTLPTTTLSASQASVAQFDNESSFQSYVAQGQRRTGDTSYSLAGTRVRGDAAVTTDVQREAVATEDSADAGAAPTPSAPSDSGPSRIADTNVQVGSLDEPDIVKNDGRNFYYAPERQHVRYAEPQPVRQGDATYREPPERAPPDTHVIDASDPDAPEAIAEINTTGKLLQTGDRLIVFENRQVVGYDVSDPENPTETWSHPLNGSFVTARSANGTVYLVTESSVGIGSDCGIEPLGPQHTVPCTDVYRPTAQVAVDATYSAFRIDAADGEVDDSVSFVGTSQNSVVYMSQDALYVTYTKETSRAALVGDYVRTEFDRTPSSVDDRITEIQSYDISTQSKLREIRATLNRWYRTLSDEEAREIRTEFREGLQSYLSDRKRNLTRTGIVRVDVSESDLAVESTGVVPGEPLNQFSLSQHNGTLRIATTIPRTGGAESENDLYTLDASSLERQGAVTGMGDDQRVYSVRYVGDTAYVVTFRQVDPLHVVDVSDPENPVERGTLELPGYSSYLHPVNDDKVLGIGEEDGRVKAVLFDVSDPTDPEIADSKVFDQYFSAVSNTHHAFLMDRRHGVFVLPANQESLVVDYTGGDLSLEESIETDQRATRTRYVDDSLYVFAGSSVTVVDENNWTEQTTLDLQD